MTNWKKRLLAVSLVLAAAAATWTGSTAQAAPCCSSCEAQLAYCLSQCGNDPNCAWNCDLATDRCFRWCSFSC